MNAPIANEFFLAGKKRLGWVMKRASRIYSLPVKVDCIYETGMVWALAEADGSLT